MLDNLNLTLNTLTDNENTTNFKLTVNYFV